MPFIDDTGRPAPTAPRRPRARHGQPPPAPAGAPAGVVDPYDTSGDPTLQRILALGQQRKDDAEAEALRLRKQLAIDYGDSELARSLGLDEETIAAAAQNPFSRIAKMRLNEVNKPRALDEGLGNLFYSSTGNQRRSDLSSALLEDRANAERDVRGGLSGIENSLLATERDIQSGDISANEDAAQRLRDRLGDLPLGGGAATGGAPATGTVASALTRGAMPRPRAPRRQPAATRRLPRGH